jgi:hypothetical protein
MFMLGASGNVALTASGSAAIAQARATQAAQNWLANEARYVNTNGTWTRRPSGVSDAALQLERALTTGGQPRPSDNHAPHHIVGFAERDGRTQQLLTQFGITPNEAANGVWLSREMHTATYGNAYRIWIERQFLGVETEVHARAVLSGIRDNLNRGDTPWRSR